MEPPGRWQAKGTSTLPLWHGLLLSGLLPTLQVSTYTSADLDAIVDKIISSATAGPSTQRDPATGSCFSALFSLPNIVNEKSVILIGLVIGIMS